MNQLYDTSQYYTIQWLTQFFKSWFLTESISIYTNFFFFDFLCYIMQVLKTAIFMREGRLKEI